MSDTSASIVHLMYLLLLIYLNYMSNYSWSSNVLTYLYQTLDQSRLYHNNIGCCMLILQSWAWDRIPCISPTIKH